MPDFDPLACRIGQEILFASYPIESVEEEMIWAPIVAYHHLHYIVRLEDGKTMGVTWREVIDVRDASVSEQSTTRNTLP